MLRQAIDAGHGMSNRRNGVNDPGAVNGVYFEHNLNAGLAHMVKDILLTQSDVQVLLIESGLLYARDNRASTWGADQYIAIHFDSFDHSASGTTCYINRGKGTKSPEYIMAQRTGEAVAAAQGIHFRGVKQMDFTVLAGKQPDFLLEVCFMSNDPELSNYLTKKDAVARAIANGLIDGGLEEDDDMGVTYDHEELRVHIGTDAASRDLKSKIVKLTNDAGKATVATPTFRDSWRGWLGTKLN
jgi:N-acetylmuramoyl-L-alanine amidase